MATQPGGTLLTIRASRDGDSVFLELLGSLVAGDPAMLLNARVAAALANGARRFVFDVTYLSRIDSAGLGALVSAYSAIRQKGGSAEIQGLQSKMQDLVNITKLTTIFGSLPPVPLVVAPSPSKTSWKTAAIWAAIVVLGLLLYWLIERSS